MTPIREQEAFDDGVIQSAQPVILRGFVAHWPIVAAAQRSPAAFVESLRHFDNGTPVDAIMLSPEHRGRIGYDDSMGGFNFLRNRLRITEVAQQVLRYASFANPPAVAVQSASIADCLPGFTDENKLAALPDVPPRIWMGNAVVTPIHLDEWNNIGCVVAGRRRFTLFPPEQIANLYIGPLDFAPTGAPMSLVSLHDPDFARFPQFRQALDAAVTAELSAGDAIFIPPLWWHHVESLDTFNVLVNYWWHALPGRPSGVDSAFDALIHGVLNVRSLPQPTRDAWRALFEYYVFGNRAETLRNIPPHRHGVLGALSPEDRARVREFLAQRLRQR